MTYVFVRRVLPFSLVSVAIRRIARKLSRAVAEGSRIPRTSNTLRSFVVALLTSPVSIAHMDPVRLTESHPLHLSVEMVTDGFALKKVRIGKFLYQQIQLPGFRSDSAPGSPEIPSFDASFVIPQGMEIEPTVETREGESLVHLNHEISYVASAATHCGPSPSVDRNSSAYQQVYGTSPVEIRETSYAGSERIASVRFWPIRYDPKAQTLSIARRTIISFRWLKHNPLTKRRPPVSTATGISTYIALNGMTVRSRRPNSRIDLVIAHTAHRDTIARYLQFKKESGRHVREHYVSGKTAEQIKEIIRQEYQSATPPNSTLLVGNIDQIPAWRGSSDNRWTDYNYQTLDNGDLPDVSLGRIPAHDPEELSAFIDKAIAREIEPRQIEDILITAGSDTSLGCPANVTKVGGKILAAGNQIHIIKRFKTEVGTQEIIKAYNDNPNIIVYDGHGNRQGMTEVPLLISGLEQLTNKAFPIVLDIACLNANWGQAAAPRNFAESILLKRERGVAGIMASGGSGYGHDFFQTIGEIMAKAKQNISIDTTMNEIGQIILASKIKHGAQDRSYWNYYGDPSSSVWESTIGAVPSPRY